MTITDDTPPRWAAHVLMTITPPIPHTGVGGHRGGGCVLRRKAIINHTGVGVGSGVCHDLFDQIKFDQIITKSATGRLYLVTIGRLSCMAAHVVSSKYNLFLVLSRTEEEYALIQLVYAAVSA